jgi:ribonuclease P protein component
MLYTVKIISNTAQKEQKNPLHMVFFVIKKKVFKKAVDRNRVKRRARKAFLDAFKEIESKNHLVMEFLGRKKPIFFLEHDMIQESYVHIVSKIKDDLIQMMNKYTN